MKRRIIGLADEWPYGEKDSFILLPEEEKALDELKGLGYNKLKSTWVADPDGLGTYGTLYLYAVKEEDEPATD